MICLRSIFLSSLVALAGSASPAFAQPPEAPSTVEQAADRQHLLERIDDAAIAQIYADGFEGLDLRDKTLIWHLYNAALAGRDIFYDQRYVHNLDMRETFEEILTHPEGVEAATLDAIHRYAKLFWINTGPYNNSRPASSCSTRRPRRSARRRRRPRRRAPASRPAAARRSTHCSTAWSRCSSTRPSTPFSRTRTPGAGDDMLLSSANNLYAGVSMADLEGFDERYPLNSRLVKRDGRLEEEVYRIDGGGRYAQELTEVVRHLEAAIPFATEPMAAALEALITWYRTGEPLDRRAYDIAWVADRASPVDTINGFTEVYMDARGVKGSWEALVYYVNREKTETIRTLAEHAQWFEDHMPWDPRYRKAGVRGITANAIDVVIEIGDAGPVTPIGINLPNDQTVREQYGSKSVSLSNVIEAYELSRPAAYRSEFTWDEAEEARAEQWGGLAGDMTTNMHEVIGHASGQLAERLGGNAQPYLREQYSALEEARADLVALYFIADPKLVEIGIFDAAEQAEIALAEYEAYATERHPAAPARPRGEPARAGSHAQPADGGPLAHREHGRDRGAPAGRQDLQRRDRCRGVSRRGCPPAGRGAADQVGRRLRRGQIALRDLRHPLRSRPARRSAGAGGSGRSAVLHRLRDAEAGGRHRRRRLGHRRRHLLSAGLHAADAGVLGEAVGAAGEPFGWSSGSTRCQVDRSREVESISYRPASSSRSRSTPSLAGPTTGAGCAAALSGRIRSIENCANRIAVPPSIARTASRTS